MKKILTVLLTLTMLIIPLSVAKADTKPTVKVAVYPSPTYKENTGNISVTVRSTGYTGNVQYRARLTDEAGKVREIYNTPKTGYYDSKVVKGSTSYTLTIPVKGLTEGSYSLTVLVKRYGVKNVSYDSYTVVNFKVVKSEEEQITIMDINKAKEQGKYVERLKYDDYANELWNKYIQNAERKTYKFYFGESGYTGLFDVADDGIHSVSRINQIVNEDKIAVITSADGKEKYACASRLEGWYMMSRDEDEKYLHGKYHLYGILLCEIAYDNVRDIYYITKVECKEMKSATVEVKPHKKGEAFKYLAVPVFCADVNIQN